MEEAKRIVELAQLIPARNINFYIDACCAMSAVNLNDILGFGETDITTLRSLIMVDQLKAKPQAAIEMLIAYLKDAAGRIGTREGVKILGKLIITHLRKGEFQEKGGPFTKLPLSFLGYAVAEDLMLHGLGPNYSFVGKFLDELVKNEIIKPGFSDYTPQTYEYIRTRCTRYTREDMAAIFLGYSLASKGSLLPIVPFPARPVGFVSVLISEIKKLLPQLPVR